jgi:hypothetical protein
LAVRRPACIPQVHRGVAALDQRIGGAKAREHLDGTGLHGERL